ncbi:hypothetical protein JTB14_009705 [Gonioctena quinquepunctata]|nr:hypothetical protein JTB14_009705 [Gonioctena quinquepunctata]
MSNPLEKKVKIRDAPDRNTQRNSVSGGIMARKEDFGEPLRYDPDFNGPLKRRSCTDVLCLAFFLVFVAVWIGIGLYAITNGDPSMLLVPKDSKGRRCGKDFDVLDKPYLLFHDLTKCIVSASVPFSGCQTPQVCVKQCPTDFYVDGNPKPLNFQEYCVEDDTCPKWLLPSTPFLNRCLYNVADRKKLHITDVSKVDGDETLVIKHLLKPVYQWMTLVLQNSIAIFSKNESHLQVGQNIVEDIMHSWWKILIGILMALLACIVYILILRWTAAVVVWISVFGVIVALAVGVYFTAVKYKEFQDKLNDPGLFDGDRPEVKTSRDLWLAGLIILSTILVIILLMLIFLRKRIVLAIALIEEGSKAVSSVTASLFFPIIPWILQVGIIVYFVAVAIYLSSTGQPLYKAKVTEACASASGIKLNSVCDQNAFPAKTFNSPITTTKTACANASCLYIKLENDALFPYLQAYNIFGFFWLAFFVSALGQMVLASVFAQWYWTFNKRTLPFFAVTSALRRTLRFHMGTLAFGSLIVAICRMIRVILEYIDHKVKKYDNELTRAIMCFFKCFFYCLEKFLRFINKNAYIMCAVHGKNFCASAKDAFMLLMRNVIRVFVLDKVTDFLFFLSKLLLTMGVGAVAYVLFATDLTPKLIDNSGIHYGLVPVVIIMVSTFLIATLFFSVYSMAVDTLFMCFLEDSERNDGSSEKPFYMSKNLMKILGKKNKMD